MSQAKLLGSMLRRIQSGDAWHGPSASELLDGVTAEEAAQVPIQGSHSIWVLVRHIAAWRNAALRALDGQALAELPDEQNFPPVESVTSEAWQAARDELDASAADLTGAIAKLSDEQLAQPSPGQRFPLVGLLHVVLQHDTYHLGQIALSKKLVWQN